MRMLISAGVMLAVTACAADPVDARREAPRLGAVGWVVADAVEAAPRDAAFDVGARQAAEALDARVEPGCAEPRASAIVRAETLPASDPALVALGQGGVVTRARVAVDACGERRLHTVYERRGGAGDAVFVAGAPGGSIASLGLQRDVTGQIVAQAVGVVASAYPEGACDSNVNEPWVLDTAVFAPPQDGRWEETWTLSACGERRTIRILFEETPTGARFSSPIALEGS